ncbi:MAG: FG-GAP-like repeat-containing protein [Candidatus Krumholzibacteriia bacterium]
MRTAACVCLLAIVSSAAGACAAAARAPDARPGWELLTPDAPQLVSVDARGRVWTLKRGDCVRLLERVGSAPATPATTEWRDLPTPSGYEALHFAVTPDDTLYIVCADNDGGLNAVFRRGTAAGASWEALPAPAAYGLLRCLAVDGRARVWLGGERGEVFRLQGRRWVREVLPVPLHCDFFLPAAGDSLWARTSSKGDVRIVMRTDGVWRTVIAAGDKPFSNLMYADPEIVILNIGTTLHRVRADRPGDFEPWIDLGTHFVAVESPRSAWGIRDLRLVHARDGVVTDEGEVPFLPVATWWTGGRIWVSAESGLWRRVGTEPAADIAWPLRLRPERLDVNNLSPAAAYGVGVLRLDGEPHLYLARHSAVDDIVPLGSRARMQGWRELTARLGAEKADESVRWMSSYEMAVVAADLDADGDEDLVVSTMHDGCRLLRNMRDRRFALWTEQSGLAAWQRDVAEDVDLLDADSDGDLDLFVCNLQGDDRLLLNNGAARFVNVLPASGIVSPYGSTSALCRDLDGDGDTDIVVSSCGAGLFLHENLGVRGGAPRFRTRVLRAPIANPEVPTGLSTENFTGVEAVDFDGDGLPDLFVGGRSQPTLYLHTRGGMQFEPDPAVFRGGPPGPKVAGITALDSDADGDWDLALTGTGGTRFLENDGGRLGDPDGRAQVALFSPAHYSTGSVLVDVDADGDLDYAEALLDLVPMVYYNENLRRPLIVRVRGPQANRSAVGATVEVRFAGTGRRAAPAQEIAGGSGYASHRTKDLAFGGLSADARYDIAVRLPSGRRALRRDAPGQGTVTVDLQPGLRGAMEGALTRAAAGLRDRWTRLFWLATLVSFVAVGAYAALQRRRLGIAYPWLGVAAVPVIAGGVRRLLGLDPGGMPVVVATLGGLACGLLAVGLARPRPRLPATTMLADFGRSLRLFDHNRTPRKIIDRIMLVRANAPTCPADWPAVVPLLREDVALFGVVVAPELAFMVEGARSVGLDHAEGERLLRHLKSLQRRLLAAGDGAWAEARQLACLDELIETTVAFRTWTGQLRQAVDARLATPLRPFLESYASSRMALNDATITLAAPAVTARIPGPELARVLDVLLENAVRACGGRHVTLSIGGETISPRRARLAVCDDGPGVPPDLRPRIFALGVSGSAGGTGYGLFAARRTLEDFDGSIVLVDAPAGACFAIELAIIRESEA